MGIEGFNFNQPNDWTGRYEPVQSGLILQKPPKENFSKKRFGDFVEGEIVSDTRVTSRNSGNNSNQQEIENTNDTRERLAYTSAYANSVREQVRASATEQGVARANMIDLNQPITQQQFLALNRKLDTIGGKLDQLNSLLGSKSVNTEASNLRRTSLIDNPDGNTEIGMA